MFTALFNAIAAIPALFKMVESFAGWISEQVRQVNIKAANAELAKAVAEARLTKDTSHLDHMFIGQDK